MTIKLMKSLIGCKADQIATAHALGLKKDWRLHHAAR